MNAGDLDSAWALLSPDVQAQFGGYDVWSDGLSRLEFDVPDDPHDREAPRKPAYDVVQATVEDTPCGTTADRTFHGTWKLEPHAGEWRIATADRSLVGPARPRDRLRDERLLEDDRDQTAREPAQCAA